MAKQGLAVNVDVTKLEIFKQLCQVLIDMSKDERIPMEVREEMFGRVNSIIEG